MRRQRGFTLPELMVVVAIVTITAALAARMYGSGGESTPSFARTVLATMLDARHTALALGKPTEVYVTGSSLATYTREPSTGIYTLQSTLNAPSTAQLCTPDNTAVLGTLGAQPSCPASSTSGTSICINSSGKVSVATTTGPPTSTSSPCSSTTNSNGATLYLDSKNGQKKYRIVVWGLTGMAKVIDQW